MPRAHNIFIWAQKTAPLGSAKLNFFGEICFSSFIHGKNVGVQKRF